MGFGKKKDPDTNRTIDLDATYKKIIRPAVESAGCKCIRADEIVESGIIDRSMAADITAAAACLIFFIMFRCLLF